MIRRALLSLLLAAGAALCLVPVVSADQPVPLLTLDSQADASTGETIALSAYLIDPAGNPIPGQQIVFTYEGTFFNTGGSVLLGTATTDQTGLALLKYMPTSEGEQAITASFAGNKVFAEAAGTATVSVSPGVSTYEEPTPFRIPGANVNLVVGVLLVLWGLFFFVTVLFWMISRAGSKSPSAGESGR